jgi:hypothetical protein
MAPRTRRAVSSPEPESINPDDVPGSDEPAHSDSGRDNDINDPDAVPILRKAGSDIRFFFDKTGSKTVCKECRYVSYVLNSLVF